MKKFFDKKNNRLVYVDHEASPEFWDGQWADPELKKSIMGVSNQSFVKRKTKAYLPVGAKILEGGCGRGQYVYALKKWGYKAVGLDFAPETVKKVSELFPDMEIILGDVRSLPFDENSFDGYWSFGVIEHFYDGFEHIALEMKRVVKTGGFVFVTFPTFSFLRKIKAYFGFYPIFFENEIEKEKFYQFALDPNFVVKKFETYGFVKKEVYPLDGIKGIKDEVRILNPILRRIYHSKSFPMKVLRELINRCTRRFAGHSVLCIFEVKK